MPHGGDVEVERPLAHEHVVGDGVELAEGLGPPLASHQLRHVGAVAERRVAEVRQRLAGHVLRVIEVGFVARPVPEVVAVVADVDPVRMEELRRDRADRPVVVVGEHEQVVNDVGLEQRLAERDVAPHVVEVAEPRGRETGEFLVECEVHAIVGAELFGAPRRGDDDGALDPRHEMPDVVPRFLEDLWPVAQVDDLHGRAHAIAGRPSR